MDRSTFVDIFGGGHSVSSEINDIGARSITRWEKFMPTRYLDAHKKRAKWAIGYGHTEGGDVEPIVIPEDMVLTEPEAHAIFILDLERKAKFTRGLVQVSLTSFMWQALYSLVYNIGQGNAADSEVFPLLNQYKYTKAAARFMDHTWAWMDKKDEFGNIMLDPTTGENVKERMQLDGLIGRRGTEIGMFYTKVD